jgi:cell division septation protein DedD
MTARITLAALPLLLAALLVTSACSSSDELEGGTGATSEQSEGEFKKTATDETVLPSTDKPPEKKPADAATEKQEAGVPADDESLAPATANPGQAPTGTQKDAPVTTPAPVPQQAAKTGAPMWSVQLGAFRQESGATQMVTELKQKFNQPVYRSFDAASGFYKVTLGSFPNREQATAYKMEVQARGYPDAFVVEVTR